MFYRRMDKTPRTQLEEWLRDEGRARYWLAAQLGITPTTVSGWLHRGITPQPGHRARLEAITGIPSDAWENA